ncbi:MAG: diacylglycerol kinase family lipid kinase [Dehalococcoidia bacterium]|nr:diacylglycerol kinase family lipid kinase [Dehalococcoidia bacterium]
MNTAYIVNSLAVDRSYGRWHRVQRHIKSSGHHPTDVRMTKALGEATRLAREAAQSGYQMVVAVGGDGTVNEVLNGLFENGVPLDGRTVLGIVPLGSGCDLARTLGITAETSPVLRPADNCATRKIDVGKVEFTDLEGKRRTRLFINIADLGAGGLVVEKASKAPRILGRRPNYVWGILTAAVAYKARRISISIDGKAPLDLLTRNAIVANGRYFGRGFLAAPEASLDDGLFDIVNVGDLGTLEALWNVPRLRNGTHLSHPKVSHYRGRRVEVTSDDKVLLEMDGDLVGTLPCTCEVIPAAINVMV